MDIASVALAGMQRAEARVETSAKRLASFPAYATESSQAADTVDLSAEMVALLEARTAFKVNIKVLQTYDEMLRHEVDILG